MIFIALALACISLFYIWKQEQSQAISPGIIILLNGPSGSGKSTIQKELQKLFPTPYLGIGLDTFFVGILPERFVVGPRLEGDIDPELVMKGVVDHDQEGNRLFTLEIGPVGDKVMYGMHHAIAAYALQGNNCIVDYIAYKKEWLKDLCAACQGIKVYLVGVDAPLEILEQREKARGRAFVEGHARSHYITVHEAFNNQYDLRVDSSLMDAKTCAQTIHDFVTAHDMPQAFSSFCH